MKSRLGNLCLSAAALGLLAGSALAQSANSPLGATRSISVVGTPTDAGKERPGTDKSANEPSRPAEGAKEAANSDSTAKPLPPIPTELTGTADTKDQSSIVVTPAPGSQAAKETSAVAVPPPAPPSVGKDKPSIVGSPPAGTADADKDKVISVRPAKPAAPAKGVVQPRTADVESGGKSHRHHDYYDPYEHDRYSGDHGRHRHHDEDHCEDPGY